MDKKYQIYYSVFNDTYFAFGVNDISDIELRIKKYLKEHLIDNFYTQPLFYIYEGDILIKTLHTKCDYSYF